MPFSTGTFAGTTALSIALVVPEDGQVVTIDFKDDWVATGRPIWKKVRSVFVLFIPKPQQIDGIVSLKKRTEV